MIDAANIEVVKTIAVLACPFLIAIIGWFARAAFKENSETTKALQISMSAFDKNSAVTTLQIKNITDDLTAVVGEIKNLRTTQEDVAILKRDLQTAWKRIDELRDMVMKK